MFAPSCTRRWFLAATVICCTLAHAAHAQTTGTIRGTVTDGSTQRPLSDVQVALAGLPLGAVSALNGEFVLGNVPAGERLVQIRRIGYTAVERTVTVAAGREARLDVALSPSATQLDQIVVTGTAGGAEKRTLGNSVTTIDVAELTEKASVLNISEVLQSKSPGVTMLPGSGTPGTAGEIRIRGASSLSGYRPVVYIDGIRYNIDGIGNFAATGFGTAGLAQSSQVTSALDFINPNDIESIEIIKGPAAATLYGAEAANGVIQIITKKGTRGQQPLRWTAKYERGTTEWDLETPTNFTTCDTLKVNAVQTDGTPTWPGCQTVPLNSVITDNPIQRDPNALRTGDLERLSLSLRGGGDSYSFYVAGDRDTDEGVFFNSFNNRRSGRGNFTFVPNDKSDFTFSINYLQTDLRLPIGDESPAGILLSGVRGRPGLVRPDPIGPGWSTIDPVRSNRYNNRTKSDRLTLGATVNLSPFQWFRNRLTVGLDNTSGVASLLFLPGDDGAPTGAALQQNPITRVYTIDYAGTLLYDLNPDVQTTTTFGTQIIANRFEQLNASGTGLGAPDVTIIGSAQVTAGSNVFSENNSVGYFVQEQVGWKNRLFLTGAVRADDNSAFGTEFNTIVYPKASLSYVISEEPALAGWMDAAKVNSFKLRGAWGQAGRAPTPYSASQTYGVSVVTLGTQTGSAVRAASFGNPDLKPERGSEIELGFDVGMLDERLGIDFTYYDKTTSDMLVTISTAPSTGFPVGRLGNLGEVTNSGIELALRGTPVLTPNFTWDNALNISTNKNRLVSFGVAGKTSESPSGQAYGAVQRHTVGHPLGGYWAQFAERNPDGTPVLSSTGAVVLGPLEYIGPSVPTREIGFSNTFTFFKNFRLYALFDYKGGHHLFNLKERNRCQSSNDNCARTNDPRVRFPQNAQDSLLAAELPVWRAVPGEFIEKADFIKLREVSVTFSIPERWIVRTGASAASFTLTGRNLALWTDYSGIDPEVNSYGGRLFVRADAYAAPMTRRLAASVNLIY